jgi:hypothetical protein
VDSTKSGSIVLELSGDKLRTLALGVKTTFLEH